MLNSILAAASLAWGSPADLGTLSLGQRVSSFTARAVYLDAEDAPMGARFIHDDGLPVDVLFFASVPQVSLYARTLAVSEKGEPHTGEHLLIGKGLIGKYLNSLIGMRLADHTAATYNDLTNYQFHTSAGPEGFYELLETYLKALLHPEFTDEEVRREVCDLEVAKDGGGLRHLEEKGTVYNEMVSTMEKPDAVNWDQLGRMVFGPDHPLGRNQGGEPSAIRSLTPEEIRRFHGANYHLGPNMALIAALPLSWRTEEFLGRLGEIVARLEQGAGPASYAALPPARSQSEKEIKLGAFPSDDPNVPQNALLAWRPLENASKEDLLRTGILLGLLGGGETSFLYKDIVEQNTRKFDSGATNVSAGIDNPPLAFPLISIEGLPAGALGLETLEKLRGVVRQRIAWLAGLKPGEEGLVLSGEKARSLISASRRSMLKFMDDPPHFGDRGSGIAWHRHLDLLNDAPGFEKSVSMKEAFDTLQRQVESGLNPWTSIARKAGLLETPYVSAVKPEAGLLKADKEDKERRLKAQEALLVERFKAKDSQSALALFEAEIAGKTKDLEARERSIAQPSFVKDPPMTLDYAEYLVKTATPTRGLVETFFGSTPFTDIHLYFDLAGLPEADRAYLPLLSAALSDVGMRTRQGETLDFVKAQERWRGEIYGLGSGDSVNPKTGRVELSLSASASSPEEVDRAAEWLENYLLRRSTGPGIRTRLADILRSSIQSGRNIFQQPEENWVTGAAQAYVYQDQPAYMALHSPFTGLRYQTRLRWRLADEPALLRTLAELEEALKTDSREDLARKLAAAPGELAEFFSFELAHLPPLTWKQDFSRLLSETRSDASAASTATIAGLESVLDAVLVRDRARVHLMGSAANVKRAEDLVAGVLEKLPESSKYPKTSSTPSRAKRPVHVALVNNGTKTGVHLESADGPDYHSRSREDALDFLAVGAFEGAGPHGFFMKTWSAGLAYSNGIRANPASGRIRYYAERCPDLISTMRFVTGLAAKNPLDDPYLLEYSLANAFDDYRGAEDFSSRGLALAADLTDGVTPEAVAGFKSLLIKTAREPGTLAEVRKRMPRTLGRVLTGYDAKVSKAPGAVGFVIGPETLLSKYEVFLKENKETDSLLRLYPRDFWP